MDNLSTPDSELSQATVSEITHQNHFQAPLFDQTHIPTSSINIPRVQTTLSSDVQPTHTVVSMANFQAQLDFHLTVRKKSIFQLWKQSSV